MRQADRSAVSSPAYLTTCGELAKVRKHLTDPAEAGKSYPFSAYRNNAVKHKLELLFHGKCAYCETNYSANAPIDVEHFRPKNSPAEDPSHPGYWWLAMDWENLLPSCSDCNRRREQIIVDGSASLADLWRSRKPIEGNLVGQAGKGRCFPVRGTRAGPELRTFGVEDAMLVDPCREEPSEHVDFRLVGSSAISLAVPAGGTNPSERGAVTIQAFGLNRLGLVQERTKVIRRLEFLRDLMLELDEVLRGLEDPVSRAAIAMTPARGTEGVLRRVIRRMIEEMAAMAEPTQPYSAAARAWLRDFMSKI